MAVVKGPSQHLSWVELACRDGTEYPEEWRSSRAIPLSVAFEYIRTIFAGPIHISSGFRTEAYNRSIGGAKKSQHVQGRALDLHPIGGSLGRLQKACEAARRVGLVTGIGYYRDFVHVDIRPGQKRTWGGSRRNTEN